MIFKDYLKTPRAFWPQAVYSTAMSLEWLSEFGSIEKSCIESKHFSKKNLQNAVKTTISIGYSGDSVTFGHLGTKLIFTAHQLELCHAFDDL